MIILILISQYFYNNMRQVITVFYQDPQLTIFFLSTFNNWLPRFFCGIFLKVLCQFQKFCSFIKKKYMNILSKILAYFAVDNEMKFFLILSISLSSLYFFSQFFFPSSIISDSKRVTMSMCMVKKSSTSKAKTYISYYFFSQFHIYYQSYF